MLKRILLPAMSVAFLFAACAAIPAYAYDTHTKINFENQSSHSTVKFAWGKEGHTRAVDQDVAPGGKLSIDEKAPAILAEKTTYDYFANVKPSPHGHAICRIKYKVTNIYDLSLIPGPKIIECEARIVSGEGNCMLEKPKISTNGITCTSKVVYIDGVAK